MAYNVKIISKITAIIIVNPIIFLFFDMILTPKNMDYHLFRNHDYILGVFQISNFFIKVYSIFVVYLNISFLKSS